MDELRDRSKLAVAAAAGLLAFVLAASFWLSVGPVEGWEYLALFAGVPAFVLTLLPFQAAPPASWRGCSSFCPAL